MESPINIATADAVYAPGLPSLLFNYATSANLILTDINATNTEGTVRAVVNTASSLGFNGSTFNLPQFHFHAGAEHAVNGHLAAMEMHFVHQSSSDGSFLVVSRLMEIGIGDNPLLAPIFSGMHLIPHSGDTLPLTGFDITALLPEEKSVYRYDGSFTTSPLYNRRVVEHFRCGTALGVAESTGHFPRPLSERRCEGVTTAGWIAEWCIWSQSPPPPSLRSSVWA